MSIFKTKWIVIKINKGQENNFLYTIFSYDYGKITTTKKYSKKEKNLDLWYLINFEIETKEKKSIHKIKNIKIKSEFNFENKSFTIINSYLELLSSIVKNIPSWIAVYEVFDIIETINNKKEINEIHLLLAQLKMLMISWKIEIPPPNPPAISGQALLSKEGEKDKIIKKILKFIDQNNINRILKLSGIEGELKEELENIL